MNSKEVVYREIEHWIGVQQNKGKAMSHDDATWASIVMDYLGRSVRRVFVLDVADYNLVAKLLAVGVAWLAQRVEDGWLGDAAVEALDEQL